MIPWWTLPIAVFVFGTIAALLVGALASCGDEYVRGWHAGAEYERNEAQPLELLPLVRDEYVRGRQDAAKELEGL